jgi:uncharacterized protein (UPF0332 family)
LPRGFNPRKFLELGQNLLNDKAYETDCKCRTAIGRFYYAAFLVALEKLQDEGISIQDTSTIHQEVIGNYMDRGLSHIGDLLDQLREKRVDADYHMNSEIKMSACHKYAALSERAIQFIEQAKKLT